MSTTALRVSPPGGVARVLAGVRDDGRPLSLSDHLDLYGPLETGRALIGLVDESGLCGRGGGGFPAGQKLRAVAAQRGTPVVVVNAAEGEPGSGKDKALLRSTPHLVLDGAAAAAAALGARQVIVAVGRDARAERAVLVEALAERRDRLRWRLAPVAEGFVAGEETALLASLAGRPAKPAVKPPYPFERGVDGAPTLVQNAETLAHMALIARYGPHWFRSLGSTREPGTTLVTLSGAVARPGVYEIELGTPLSHLVAQAGGPTEPSRAFLVGGYFGGWTTDEHIRLTRANGLGPGVVVAMPASTCGVRETARVARYLAGESVGQCGPCTFGLDALAGGLERVAGGRADDRGRLERWTGQISGRGACRHPDGATRFVQTALDVFRDEVGLHLRRGRCGATDRGVLAA
ncbi:MAG TPA: NADH-ubiquinone oxidoreductase-F iron-sulfur binding region domain-containing protein [Gaiellaceae bacterium]|nr:NADH-ubiquinone oxidoreductase-F iron-sulfur binding region domain-containing protein [Gaiellaceae bacterium]